MIAFIGRMNENEAENLISFMVLALITLLVGVIR